MVGIFKEKIDEIFDSNKPAVTVWELQRYNNAKIFDKRKNENSYTKVFHRWFFGMIIQFLR